MFQLFIVGVGNKWLRLRLVSMLCHIIQLFCIILNNGEFLILPPDLHTLHAQLVYSSIMCVPPTDSTPCKCLHIQFSKADSSGIHCLVLHDYRNTHSKPATYAWYYTSLDPSPLPGGDVHSWDHGYLEPLVVAHVVTLHTLLVQWCHQLYPVHVCVCVYVYVCVCVCV